MRVTFNIDCTPDEARAFFGAPDVKPLQEAVLRKMQEQFEAQMALLDPAEAMRQWQEMSQQSFQQFQQLFLSTTGEAQDAPPARKAG